LLIREGKAKKNPVQVRKENSGSVYVLETVAVLVVKM
jgi:hypothetical protein